MKKLLLLTGIAFTLPGLTQVTVTSSNLPNVGDQLDQASDTLPSVTVGNAGANQTWDYSTLGVEETTTLTFAAPQWTPNGAAFPNSNLAMVINPNRIFYMNKSGSGLELVGFVGDLGYGTMVLNSNDSETIVEMPMNYGDTYNDASLIDSTISAAGLPLPGVDSARVVRRIIHEYEVDAWGSLTTPNGTFDVLRQKSMTITVDSIWTKPVFPSLWVFFSEERDTTYGYAYWSNDTSARFPLVELTVDENDNVEVADWMNVLPTLTNVKEQGISMEISIYPNPSSDILYLDYETNFDKFSVFDVTGKEVLSKTNNNHLRSLSLRGLKPGVYFLSVYKNEERRTIRFVKS